MPTSLEEAAIAGGQPGDTLPKRQPHVLICTPCHSGKVDINYHISISLMGAVLAKAGVNYTLDYNVGMSVDWARSQMASNFLKNSEFTHLLFIDDDIAFSADLPLRLLKENVDIVAVPYRRKNRELKYNIRHGVRVEQIPGRPYMCAVESIATGFMLIRRNVFQTLAPRTPEFLYDNNGDGGWLFFRHQLVNDKMVGGVSYMGEDYFFCKTAIEAGFKVWAFLDEHIGHIGNYAFDGTYADHVDLAEPGAFRYPHERLPLRMITK